MRLSDEKLFAALARAAERRVGEFNANGHANIAWAFATVKHSDEKLFTALPRAVERRMGEFNTQKPNVSPTQHGHLRRLTFVLVSVSV